MLGLRCSRRFVLFSGHLPSVRIDSWCNSGDCSMETTMGIVQKSFVRNVQKCGQFIYSMFASEPLLYTWQ